MYVPLSYLCFSLSGPNVIFALFMCIVVCLEVVVADKESVSRELYLRCMDALNRCVNTTKSQAPAFGLICASRMLQQRSQRGITFKRPDYVLENLTNSLFKGACAVSVLYSSAMP